MKEVQELVGIVPWTFVAQICNLFLTVFLVKKFLFDRINKVVEERKQMADSQIADATKAKEEAKSMRDQYEASISNAKDEARRHPLIFSISLNGWFKVVLQSDIIHQRS